MSDSITEKKLFTTKDIVYIIGFAFAFAASWYNFDKRMVIMELDNKNKTERIISLESEIQTYRALPQKITNIDKTSTATYLLVGTIRDALIAKGIIKPAR